MEIQVLARWERLLHVQMFNKRNLYQFLWMDCAVYCAYMYIILRVSVTQSLICRCSLDDSYLFFLYCGVSYESVYVCVVVSLRPVCFSICKFWQILINLAIPICTYLILNIFCSPVVSLKSHLSLRTNTNVLTLFLITVFGEGKWRHYLYCMYLILFTYVYNTEISCTNGSCISHGNFFHCYINLCFRDKLYMYM